jgi:hypothetical protein
MIKPPPSFIFNNYTFSDLVINIHYYKEPARELGKPEKFAIGIIGLNQGPIKKSS